MTVSELKAILDTHNPDAQVVLLTPHCCGDGDDFEPLSPDAIAVIPSEGMRRHNLNPMAAAYLRIQSPIDDKAFAGCVLLGKDE